MKDSPMTDTFLYRLIGIEDMFNNKTINAHEAQFLRLIAIFEDYMDKTGKQITYDDALKDVLNKHNDINVK